MGTTSALDSIDDFRELVKRIGDDVGREFSGEQNGNDVKGLHCNHGANRYLIIAQESQEFIQIQFQYSVINDFTVAKLDEEGEEEFIITIGPDEDEPEIIQESRQDMMEFLYSIEDDVAERFNIEILEKLRNNSIAYQIQTVDQNLITGFNIFSRLFPLENPVTAKELNDSVQSVMSLGVPVRAYIQYSYGLRQYSGGLSFLNLEQL